MIFDVNLMFMRVLLCRPDQQGVSQTCYWRLRMFIIVVFGRSVRLQKQFEIWFSLLRLVGRTYGGGLLHDASSMFS